MRWLCIASLVAEGLAMVLYGLAFGAPLVGLLAVRAVLTTALVVFTLRRNAVARVVLAGVRLMAGLVGVVMATIVDDGGLAAGVGGLGGGEILLGALLFINLTGQKAVPADD